MDDARLSVTGRLCIVLAPNYYDSSCGVSAQTDGDEEVALKRAFAPLLANDDFHFCATVTAILQAILGGETDCSYQRGFWCWENSGCCSNCCWPNRDGPHPEDYDCH